MSICVGKGLYTCEYIFGTFLVLKWYIIIRTHFCMLLRNRYLNMIFVIFVTLAKSSRGLQFIITYKAVIFMLKLINSRYN